MVFLPSVPATPGEMDNAVELPLSTFISLYNRPTGSLRFIENDTILHPLGFVSELNSFGWLGWWPQEYIDGKKEPVRAKSQVSFAPQGI